jgi:hypothetical protein
MRRPPRLTSSPDVGESDEPTFFLDRFVSISLSGLGMDMKSSLGNFRMFYTGGVDGKADGGMNKASARATFTSASFAGLFNFSRGHNVAERQFETRRVLERREGIELL